MKRKLQWFVILIALAAMVQTVVVAASNSSKGITTLAPPGEPGV